MKLTVLIEIDKIQLSFDLAIKTISSSLVETDYERPS